MALGGAVAAGTRALRVIFAGTPEFAAQALAAICDAGFVVPLVLTQPDRPAGRGMKLSPSAVKREALARGVPVAQPTSLRLDGRYPDEAASAEALLRETPHDVMVVAAYGLILPQWVLDLPPHGCINIHASLLPRWRGAAPIQRAIEAGDAETGVTLMQMDAGLDTGAMISGVTVPIGPRTTTALLHDALADAGAAAIVAALIALERDGHLAATPQPEAGVTYAEKIAKTESALDWRKDAHALTRQILAFDPFPGASTVRDGATLKVWSAEPAARPAESATALPGTVLQSDASGVVVACGAQQALRLLACQKPGGKRLGIREFLTGFPISIGQRFEVDPS
ncbi:methionyl-tRNA formyltransferase [Robbsia sp. KACC 23696]|uniref:methionyl-tRNA formyltransferase n=1 Tax=Robbsia sp. KACC 23696 TaxID=3149231 RepID=UPI00325BF31C